MSGPISDDDGPTRDDVRVRITQEGRLSIQVRDHTIRETVESEITNRIVEAIAVWTRDLNERGIDEAGRIVHRHCRLDSPILDRPILDRPIPDRPNPTAQYPY